MSTARTDGNPQERAPVPSKSTFRRDQKKICDKLVVAVHGMGDQVKNDFVQTVSHLFAKHCIAKSGLTFQGTWLPLGVWNSEAKDDAIGFVPSGEAGSEWLGKFAFAEVYWADIPRKYAKEGYKLEESKKWAASVISRMAQRHKLVQEFGTDGPRLAATVISEIAETLRILDTVLGFARKAGLADINLAALLESYLADVQQVTEYRAHRHEIITRFLQRMKEAADACPGARIHIIAHSEGSVVAFMGLLYALVGIHEESEGFPFDESQLRWIYQLDSFTTFGSPIDKHLILWPEMWHRFSRHKVWKRSGRSIRWRNYYDWADPIGFDLRTVRDQLKAFQCDAFEFEDSHDYGFRRSLVPGKAHVDYLEDEKLFSHIIENAIEGDTTDAPGSTFWGRLSVVMPFLLVALIHVAAVFVFHKALVADSNAPGVPPVVAEHAVTAGGSSDGILAVLTCAALLLGTTVLSRVLLISKDITSRFVAMAVFLGGAALYWAWPGDYTVRVGDLIRKTFPLDAITGLGAGDASRLVVILMALAVIGIGLAVDKISLMRQRPPVWGLRWLMILGGGATTALLVIPRLADGVGKSPIQLILSAVAYLYLWWLGILLFDLSYVWKRFISTKKTYLQVLRERLKPLADQAGKEDSKGANAPTLRDQAPPA